MVAISVGELEEWRPCTGVGDGYEASSFGRIRRAVPGVNTHVGKVISPTPTPRGYHSISVCVGGRCRSVRVARLVCAAFHGEPPHPTWQVNHKDGHRSNDTPSNLEWVSCRDNHIHAYAVNKRLSSHARLTPEQAVAIYAEAMQPGARTQADIGAKYGVTKCTVSLIVKGKAWSRFTGAVPGQKAPVRKRKKKRAVVKISRAGGVQ